MTITTLPRLFRIEADALALQPLELEPEDFQSPLPVQHYHQIFGDEDLGLAVGIWDTTTMQEAFGPYPTDEYVTVLDGRFAMVDAAGGTLAAARSGDSVTFRNGVPGSWKQDGYLRKIYLTLRDPKGGQPGAASAEGGFRVLGAEHLPKGSPDTDGVTREVIFRNVAGTMTVTLCAFPARTLPSAPCPSHRLIRILRGKLALTEPATPPEAFGPEAHVFLPMGTACAWATEAGTVAVIVDVSAT